MIGSDRDGVVGFSGDFDVRRLEERLADLRREMDAVRATNVAYGPLGRAVQPPAGIETEREQIRVAEAVSSLVPAVSAEPQREEVAEPEVVAGEADSQSVAGALVPEPPAEACPEEGPARAPLAAPPSSRVVTGRVIQKASKPQPIRAVVRSVSPESTATPERRVEETPRLQLRRKK